MRKKINGTVDNYKCNIELKTERQKAAWQAMHKHDITLLTGFPGTGKTFLAMAFAAQQLLTKQITQIYVTRPIMESGEKLGHLPGSIGEKTAPFFAPISEAVCKLAGGNGIVKERLISSIREVPLAYLRGRNFEDSVCILDEAQNLTMSHFILYFSRMCNGTKLILSGDERQTDIYDSGLRTVMDKLSDLPEVAIVRFQREDCCRHPLVQKIMARLQD